jgi:cerevisin
MFSQARGAILSELAGYAYDSMGGDEITVYVIDTGVDKDHAVSVMSLPINYISLIHLQEFRNMEGTIRWLYLPDEPEIEGDDFAHGTCVVSKVVGPTFGVAKNVDIVVVKIYPINGRIHVSRFIAAWGVAAADIASKNLQGKAVVTVALGGERLEYRKSGSINL